VKESGESFRMFQIILVFLAWNYQIMYLFDIGMLELSMVLLVFDFVYVLIKWLQFVCVCVCVWGGGCGFLFCLVAQVVETSGQVAPSCDLWVCVFPF
jgi:hypothetical protein